jgi:hypothetical protein
MLTHLYRSFIPFCWCFLLCLPLSAGGPPKEYMIMEHPDYLPGMFSVFNTVLGFLDAYEIGDYAGLKIDFGRVGRYYDPKRGPNWWEYYCDPIKLGSRKSSYIRRYSGGECIALAMGVECHMSRRRAHGLICKYIKVRKHIKRKIEHFCQKHFDVACVIGIHYRGTDKVIEAPRIPYEEALNVVLEHVKCLPNDDYRVFVATDEQAFLDYMSERLPGKIVCRASYRSSNGIAIHYDDQCSPYERGEQALIDALLLSKCNLLIRTSSNLSLWSTYFNSNMPVHELSRRYEG